MRNLYISVLFLSMSFACYGQSQIYKMWKGEPVNAFNDKPVRPVWLNREQVNNIWEKTISECEQENAEFWEDDGRKLLYRKLTGYLSDYLSYRFHLLYGMTGFHDPNPQYQYEFARDTFVINEIVRVVQPRNTFEHVMFSFFKNTAEEFLIYKYFSKVLLALLEKDRKAFIDSQVKWENSLRADKHLESIILGDHYTGGGTMWSHVSFADANNYRNRSLLLFEWYCVVGGD